MNYMNNPIEELPLAFWVILPALIYYSLRLIYEIWKQK